MSQMVFFRERLNNTRLEILWYVTLVFYVCFCLLFTIQELVQLTLLPDPEVYDFKNRVLSGSSSILITRTDFLFPMQAKPWR